MTYLSAAPPLLVRDARIAFGDRLVARDLTLEFPAGRTTCLLGRSGVGKTSLLRWLAGLLPDAPRSQSVAEGDTRITNEKGRSSRQLRHQSLRRY